MVAMLVFQVVVVIAFIAELRRAAAEAAKAGTSGAGGGLLPNVFGPVGRDLTSLTIALVIVTALAVLTVAVVIRWRVLGRQKSEVASADRHASVLEALEVSLDALRGEPDPRRAVIAAYAAMERSLSSAGFGRRRSEAPLEYLRRVLAAPTRAAEEVRTITLLFQHAKFSHHPVDETMRNGAIDALERIRGAAVRPA
jgi:hypothetical protein